MKKNKIILSTLIGLSSAIITTGVVLGGVWASRSNYSNGFIEFDNNSPVMFDNQQFVNTSDAYEYALSLVNSEQFSTYNQKLYSLTANNETHVFNSALDLNNWISSKITTISNAASNDMYHNLNEDKSIPINEIHKYNINTSTNTTFSDNITTIYKCANGSYLAGGQEALENAKKSYLKIHKGYYFNGIYFKTRQDLEIYLTNIYGEQISQGICASSNDIDVGNSSNYKKIEIKDTSGNVIATSDAIYMNDENNTKNEVSNFLYSNAYKYLKVSGSTSLVDTYLKFNKYTNEIEGNLGENISMSDLPVLKKVSTDNKSLYVIDANVNEKYNLYGPYFLKTDGNVTNITNPDLWEVSDDNPEEIIRSQAISILAGLFDLLMIDPNIKNQFSMDSNGNMSRKWDGESPLFYISSLSKTNGDSNLTLYNKEQKMLDAIQHVYTTDSSQNLYSDFYSMYNNLINTKNYSTIYAIPTIYNFLIDKLINYNADVSTVIVVKEYFDELCNTIQEILESIFGDLLLSYDGMKKFNFAEYFQINQYGNDGSNINGILNGYDLIKNYKGLIAGCYVLTKAIGNSQNTLQIDYDVASDDYLFELLADGNNSNQVTANKIKAKWSSPSNNQTYSTIYQLQAIYDTFSNWGTNVSDLLNASLTSVDTDDLDAKFTNIEDAISNYKANNNSMDLTSIEQFQNLQTILNVDNSLILNNNLKAKTTYAKIFIENSYIEKINLNLDFKLKSVNEVKSFLNGSGNSVFDSSQGIFKNQFKLGMKETVKSNLQTALSVSSEQKIIETSNVMTEVSEIDDSDLMDKFKVGEKVLGSIGGIINSIVEIIQDVNNPYFEDVKDQIIAAGVMNICSSVCDIVANFVPPPVNVVIQSAGFVFSFISSAIGSAEQVVYEYKVNDSDNTKYYWDGGLVMNRFWGLLKDTQRDISDLKMQSPIELITNSNNDIIYFNKNTYNDDNDDIVRKKVIKYIIDNNLIKSNENAKYSWVYSTEPNVNKLNSTNSFDSISKLADNIISNGSNLVGVGNELFINGYKFTDFNDFKDNMKSKILDMIQPVYIAKVPELDENGYPLDTQTPFHMPFPFYEPFSNANENLVCGYNDNTNEFIFANAMQWRADSQNGTQTKVGSVQNNAIIVSQNQNYITYNSNMDTDSTASTYNLSLNEIYNYITNRFMNTFDVESKTVLKSNLYTSSNTLFDSFNTSIYYLDIYLVEIIPGVKKYFINRNDAVEYILKTTTNDGSVLLNIQNKDILTYTNSNGEKLYFNNQDQFNKWFVNNLVKVN